LRRTADYNDYRHNLKALSSVGLHPQITRHGFRPGLHFPSTSGPLGKTCCAAPAMHMYVMCERTANFRYIVCFSFSTVPCGIDHFQIHLQNASKLQ